MMVLMVVLALAGGALLSIQAAINGQLGSHVGVLKSAFLTFSIGALVTSLLIFFLEPQAKISLLDVPRWQVMGALLGVPYIIIMVFAVQRLGTGVATVAVIFGQLTMSMLIDHFGWLDNPSTPLSGSRIAALALLALALLFIYRSTQKHQTDPDAQS
jgi:transporter family-2 protein